MKLHIEIDLEHVKYGDEYDREEIARLLRKTASRIADYDVPVMAGAESNIRDFNGNKIGSLLFKEEAI